MLGMVKIENLQVWAGKGRHDGFGKGHGDSAPPRTIQVDLLQRALYQDNAKQPSSFKDWMDSHKYIGGVLKVSSALTLAEGRNEGVRL